MEAEHFSGKNGALRWSFLVGKQKHNVQMTNKQAKRRECLPRAVLQHRIYLRYIRPIDNARQQIGNRKQTLWKKKHGTLGETNLSTRNA